MSPSTAFDRADVVLAGGGLANGLIALRLRAMRPDLKVILLERERRIGGEHTWRWFQTDVVPGIAAWLRPLIVHRWNGYGVRFAGFERAFETPSFALTSEHLHRAVSAALGAGAWLGVTVTEVSPHQVTLADGRRIVAGTVIDGRGPRRSRRLVAAWRNFLAQEVALAAPHGLSRPILMDASVAQTRDGRFVRVLPLDARRLLIEDSRYGESPALDLPRLRNAIADHARSQGWTIDKVLREETGSLPIPLAGDIDAFWREARPQVAEVGLRAALLHPSTGDALADAARLADQIAALPRITSASVRACVEAHSKACWRRRRYHRLLNRLLFRACPPDARVQVLERLHRLSPGLVQRFHATRLTLLDKARILVGRSPIPLGQALEQVTDRAVLKAQAIPARA